MSPAGAHSRDRKFVRTGRHAAPSPFAKAAKRAGRIAPAAALAGALVAVPHVYHLEPMSSTAMTGDIAGVHRAYLGGHVTSGQGQHGSGRDGKPAGQATSKSAAKPGAKPGPASRPGSPRPRASTVTTSPVAPASASSSPRPSSSPAPSPSPSPTASALSCSGSGGMLPANYPAIVSFLMAHGYSGMAAAGIAGNIYQESKGNPESVGTGGGGLIGWTPLPAGFVTGNPAADLRTQLAALLTYNEQWSQYIRALNAATNATQAAYIFMTDFERPGIPAAYNREGAAEAVAAACHL